MPRPVRLVVPTLLLLALVYLYAVVPTPLGRENGLESLLGFTANMAVSLLGLAATVLVPYAILLQADEERLSDRFILARCAGASMIIFPLGWTLRGAALQLGLALHAVPVLAIAQVAIPVDWAAEMRYVVLCVIFAAGLSMLAAGLSALLHDRTLVIILGIPVVATLGIWLFRVHAVLAGYSWSHIANIAAVVLVAILALSYITGVALKRPQSARRGARGSFRGRLLRRLPISDEARIFGLHMSSVPNGLADVILLIGTCVAGVLWPYPAICVNLGLAILAAQNAARRMWNSPLLEDLIPTNLDPRALARVTPLAVTVRILPFLPGYLVAAFFCAFPWDHPAATPISPGLYLPIAVTALSNVVLAVIFLAFVIPIVLSGSLGASNNFTASVRVFGMAILFAIYVGLLFSNVTSLSTNLIFDTGIVQYMVIKTGLALFATWWFWQRRRAELEDAFLRYLRDNEYSDFGEFRPIRKSRSNV